MPPEEERVPLFGTWRRAYLAVVLVFFLDVLLFWALEHFFA